jgi:hypothetical protein
MNKARLSLFKTLLLGTFLSCGLAACGKFEITQEQEATLPAPIPASAESYVFANGSGFQNKTTARSYTTSLSLGTEVQQVYATTAHGYQVIINAQARVTHEP